MADSRQRAPFAHTSSSADLTSPDILSPLRSFPGQPREDDSVETGRSRGLTVGIWGKPPRMVGSDQVNGVGVYDKAVDGSPELDTPRRSPSPRPFGLPSSFPLSTIRFVCLCALWYISSAISSNTGKVILNNFRYPITLTIVQFFFVSGYCIVCSKVGLSSRLKDPTKSILRGTLPMAVFQVGGHIFGSLAISRVPVSTVHTIKVSFFSMLKAYARRSPPCSPCSPTRFSFKYPILLRHISRFSP